MNTAQLTGNTGLFYVCYQLSLRGWNALPTIRNAKGADIISVKGKRKLGLQVKTLTDQLPASLGSGRLDVSVDFWVIVMNIRDDNKRKVFVIPQEDILRARDAITQNNVYTDMVTRNVDKKTGKFLYWIHNRFLFSGQHNYADAWECLEDE